MSNGKAKVREEDLDDLDDVLDQFTIPEPLPQTGPSGSKPQPESDIQAAEAEAAFRETWHKMIIQDLEGEGKEDSFQKAIRQAMEKLQDSDDTLKADSKTEQDSLEGLLSSLGDLKLGEDDTEGDENIESMLETMMSQLMSKDILYEPLKELDTKYPDYIAQNSSSLPQEDLSRFTDQKARVSQIIAIFEDPSYSDDNAAQSTQILRLMNEMQSYGSPPSEIMGPMPPGFELGSDGMPKFPDGCLLL